MITISISCLANAVQSFRVANQSQGLGDRLDQMSNPCDRGFLESWQIQSILNTAQMESIRGQLTDAAGHKVLGWRLRELDPVGEYFCTSWEIIPIGANQWQMNAELSRVQSGEIDECLVRSPDLESNYPVLPLNLYLTGNLVQNFVIPPLLVRHDGGIEERGKFGYNGTKDEWQITAPITEAKKQELVKFLSDRCGNYFEFRLSPDIAGKIYTCTQWECKVISSSFWEFSATLSRSYVPFREADIKKLRDTFDFYDNEGAIRGAIADTFADLASKLDGAYNWLTTYKRDAYPFILNSRCILRNSFHKVLGRGGYFPPGGAPTEAQAVIARACMYAFEVTGDIKWRSLAIETAQALLDIFYPVSIPSNWVQANGIRVPHWLATTESFVSKGAIAPDPLNYGFFDLVLTFVNGEAQIPAGSPHFGELLANVYRVYPTSDRLLWRNVFAAPIGGFSYEIDYWVSEVMLEGVVNRQYPDSESPGGRLPTPTSEPRGKIKLKTAYNGQAKIVYSAYVGATVSAAATQPLFEPYPMWRELRTGEALGAIDVFPWSEDAYDFLWQATGDSKWLSARECTRYTEAIAATVINPSNWYEKSNSPNPLAYPGSQVIPVPETRAVSTSREVGGTKPEWLRIDVGSSTAPYPSAEYQNFAVQIKAVEGMTVAVEAACSVATELEVVLSLSRNPFDFSLYYIARMIAPSGGTPVARTFGMNEFLLWDTTRTSWHPHIADDPIYSYSGGGGNVSAIAREEHIINGVPRLVWRVAMSRGGGFAGAGLVLGLGLRPGFPVTLFYSHSGSANLKITVDGKDYRRSLPANTWSLGKFSAESFEDFGGKKPNAGSYISSVEVEAAGNCTTYIWYLGGEPRYLQLPTQTYKAALVSRVKTAHTFWVGDFKAIGSPSEQLAYNPGAVPFTANCVGDGQGGQVIDAWRGIPMSGYQYPAYYAKMGYWSRLEQVLDFLLAAQEAYQLQNNNKTKGAFAPAFAWGYWDAGEYSPNGIDAWTWNAVDPNSNWEGYQCRPVESAAHAWYRLVSGNYPGSAPSNMRSLVEKSQKVTMQYLYWQSAFYVRRRSFQPPTDFYQNIEPQVNYHTPHYAAFLLRSAIYANLAGDRPVIWATTLRLIKASYNYLQCQYVDSGLMAGSFFKSQPNFTHSGNTYKEGFGFWQSEIVEAIAIALKFQNQLKYPKCVYFLKNLCP